MSNLFGTNSDKPIKIDDFQFLNFPFRDVIKYGHSYFDTINIFGSKSEAPILEAIEEGVPKEKVRLLKYFSTILTMFFENSKSMA